MLKHQMQKHYMELSSRFEGGKEKEEISETKRTWFRPMRTVRKRERGGCKLAAIGPLPIANGPLPVNK